jgi:hypothetical protein
MFSLGHLGSVLQYCLQFKATHPEFPEKVPYATRFVLHEHQALLQTKLCSYIVAAEGIEDHRSSAHHQFQNLKDFGTHLPYGHTVIHVDYKQSPTIPFGPDETGSWWFATARRSVIVFGAHIHAHSATSTEEEPCFFFAQLGIVFHDPMAFPAEGLRRAYGGPADGLDFKFVAPRASASKRLHSGQYFGRLFFARSDGVSIGGPAEGLRRACGGPGLEICGPRASARKCLQSGQ